MRPEDFPASPHRAGFIAPFNLTSSMLHRGFGLKTRILNPVDEYWDRRLGVSTFGYFPPQGQPNDDGFRVHYTPMPYSVCFSMLRKVGVDADDVLVDLGCGLGRAVFAASWLGARRAIGVDIVPELIKRAKENAERSRPVGRDIDFHCLSAEQFPLADATVLVMFHPFGAGTMRSVIRAAEEELAKRPRAFRVAYYNPVYASVLDESKLLRRIDHWPARPRTFLSKGYAVTFWASQDT